MSEFASTYLRTLSERGFIHQITDPGALDKALDKSKAGDQPLTAYIGFDCTGPSLHIGSMVQIMMLRHFQRAGHKPIVLMGGGTTKVGDPSGRDKSRKLLSDADIDANMASIRSVFERFLTFGDGPTDAVMVNNDDWLQGLGYIDFLRDIGPYFTINRMLTFDSVKLRLEREQPLTFLEFNYMILQAYDFMELYRRHNCRLQMGGSDQWGNIVNGMELARRIDAADLYGLTSRLITTADGTKMGKTAQGAVWLNPGQLSDHDYWQFWRNIQDADVGRFLKLFTDLPLDEIARLEALADSEINEAKKILANEATRLCRGDEAAAHAAETARQTFEEGATGSGLHSIQVSAEDLENGVRFIDLLVRAGLSKSKKEARRLVSQGGARLNDQPVDDVEMKVSANDLGDDGAAKLSAGRKRHALVKLS